MSLTHKNIRFTILAIMLLAIGMSLGAQEDSVDYDARLIEALEAYQEIVTVQLDEDVENKAGRSWYVASQVINQGKLKFRVDPENHPDIIAGAQFVVSEEGDGMTYVVLSKNLLDAWATRPSILYTTLAGAMQNSFNFYKDPLGWMTAGFDRIEQLFLELNMMEAQAEFVRDRMIPSGFNISGYEVYLMDSFEVDNLVSATLFLKGLSIPVAQALWEVKIEYEDSGDDEAMRAAVLDTGRALLDARNDLPLDSGDEIIFSFAVAIHSWLEFTPAMISRIYNKDQQDDPLEFPLILTREKEYAELRRQVEASRTLDMPRMEHTIKSTRSGFSSVEQ